MPSAGRVCVIAGVCFVATLALCIILPAMQLLIGSRPKANLYRGSVGELGRNGAAVNPGSSVVGKGWNEMPSSSERDAISNSATTLQQFGRRDVVSENARQKAVRAAMEHAWSGYRQYAWGSDFLKPSSNGSSNPMGLMTTLIDGLDTLFLMNLSAEVEAGVQEIAENFRGNQSPNPCSNFEVTIRILAGLLSAYDLTGDDALLERAVQVGDIFWPAYDTPTSLPKTVVVPSTGASYNFAWAGDASVLSEAGTVQLEMLALGVRSGVKQFADKAIASWQTLLQAAKDSPDGLLGIYINPATGKTTSNRVTFGANGDSFYEYQLKMWQMLGGSPVAPSNLHGVVPLNVSVPLAAETLSAFVRTVQTVRKVLWQVSSHGRAYLAERENGHLVHKMDHLVCFWAGTLAHAHVLEVEVPGVDLLADAAALSQTCLDFYRTTKSGLGPELVYFKDKKDFVDGADFYLLRPEAVESFFYLWHATGDDTWRDAAWTVFTAIEKHCKTDVAYTAVKLLNSEHPTSRDQMESFFLAETLKYLYLTFSDTDMLPLNEFVFNTEAHPLSLNPRTRM
jgi:mannosyl-oligosaccharide alpha-1,2-mannosidase